MTSVLSSATAPRARAAERLWRVAVIMLGLMPIGMAIAHRSSPVFLVGAAVLAIFATLLEGRSGPFVEEIRATLVTPLGRAGLAFLGWALVSIGWSAFPGVSFAAFGEFWLPVAAALILCLVLPNRVPWWGGWLLAASLAAACLLIMYELNTGLSLRRDLGARAASFIFNRPVLTILVSLAPALAFLVTRAGPGWVAGLMLAGLAMLTTRMSESGAAAFGLLVGVVVFLVALAGPGWIRRAAFVAVVTVFAAAPFLGPIGDRLIPAAVHEELAHSHSRDRIDIWTSFGAAIREQPILGGGFGVSPRMAETPVAADVAPQHRTLLGVGHPHNAVVQIWVELGAVGAIVAAAILILVLRALSAIPRRRLPVMLGFFAGAATVSLVGHGAWQGWWAAAIGAAIVWFRSLPPVKDEAFS